MTHPPGNPFAPRPPVCRSCHKIIEDDMYESWQVGTIYGPGGIVHAVFEYTCIDCCAHNEILGKPEG